MAPRGTPNAKPVSPMEHSLNSGVVWATRQGLGWKGRGLEGGALKQTNWSLPEDTGQVLKLWEAKELTKISLEQNLKDLERQRLARLSQI